MPNLYQDTVYPDLAHAATHPDRMAVIARLFGMEPPPVDQCRVLELGCASGGNIIPMATGFPRSTFLGIDNSDRHITLGKERLDELELANVSLQAMNLVDLDDSAGQFDYIIVHGVYSWVSHDVQERILEICENHLSPNGVAYVSYDTLPGGHLIRIVNDAMLFGANGASTPAEKIRAAREVLELLRQCMPQVSGQLWEVLSERIPYLAAPIPDDASAADSFLLHGPLAQESNPTYLHQFVAAADGHGLQYLGDAHLSAMLPQNFPPEVARALQASADNLVEIEQYMDFVRLRSFRCTLLCHGAIAIQRHLSEEAVGSFLVASAARAHDDGTVLTDGTPAAFLGRSGETFVTDYALAKLAILHLARIAPRRLPFPVLLERALEMRRSMDGFVSDDPESEELRLRLHLLRAYACGGSIIDFNTARPEHVEDVSDRPAAAPSIRMQARDALGVTNLWHEWIPMDAFSQHLLPLLDGTKDVGALCDYLHAFVTRGGLALEEGGEPVRDDQRIRQILEQLVTDYLPQYAASAMLVA